MSGETTRIRKSWRTWNTVLSWTAEQHPFLATGRPRQGHRPEDRGASGRRRRPCSPAATDLTRMT
jgi:hypothetical protein